MDTPESTGVTAPAAVVQQSDAGQPAQPAAQPDASAQPDAGAQPEGQPEGVSVPLNVVTALRDELSTVKSQREEAMRELEIQRMAQSFHQGQPQPQQPQPQQQPQQAADPLHGIADDEVVMGSELKTALQSIAAAAQQNPTAIKETIQPLQQELSKLQLQMQDPNYEQTIRTYLPKMVTANPALQQMITGSPNQLQAALAIAKMSPEYQAAQQAAQQATQQPQSQQPQADPLQALQQIIDNATKPGSPAAAGGGAGLSGHDKWANMPQDDFDAEVERVIRGGGGG